jgi:hypothetical protein
VRKEGEGEDSAHPIFQSHRKEFEEILKYLKGKHIIGWRKVLIIRTTGETLNNFRMSWLNPNVSWS